MKEMNDNSPVKAVEPVPYAPLGIIPLRGEEKFASEVDGYLQKWRSERNLLHRDHILYSGYERDSFIIDANVPRFGSGEGKGVITESVRGDDLYFIVDVTNSSIEYKVNGVTNRYSPDDHFSDLKRLIAAAGARAKRMTVFMPFLYEGRVSERDGRASLDCAQMLQELESMGVSTIITFDAHEPRVQNAIPLTTFETVQPVLQEIKVLLNEVDDLSIDSDHMMVVSPDEGGMPRAIYFANTLGLDMGMFYRRKDYSQVQEDGQHPVVAFEFLGSSVEGKDVILVDDMISSGDTLIDTARSLKNKGARRIFCFASFGLFTGGLKKFDDAVWAGYIDKVFTTDAIYIRPELKEKPWYRSVPLAKYVAYMIDTLNHDLSLSSLLQPYDRINTVVAEYKKEQEERRNRE